MGFYDDKVLPHLIDFACSQKFITELREKVVPLAEGQVLEVGMGSGLNLALYDASKIDFVWGLEPSLGMRQKAAGNVANAAVEVKWLDLPGEEIPLDDASVDTVLLTFTLCSIPDWQRALQQMHRVLKPGGKLLFCEHGRAPDGNIRKWQDRITPTWRRLMGGCHLNRPIRQYIEETGFVIEKIETGYAEKVPRFLGFMSWGLARRAA
jgi:ubiquinone/menaquinone biosynthesis C-methylase UbiE